MSDARRAERDLKDKVFPSRPVSFLAVTKDGKQVRATSCVEMTAERGHKPNVKKHPRLEGDCPMPWLVGSAVVGTVSHEFEPDIKSLETLRGDIELYRLGAAIGYRRLSSDELAGC